MVSETTQLNEKQWLRRVLIESEPVGETVDSRDMLALKNWAQATACIRLVWIFGSRVRGEGRHNSDLDVAVEIDPIGRDELAQPGWMELSPGWRAELGKVLQIGRAHV